MKGTRFGRTKKDAELLTTEIDRAAELVAAEQAMGAANGVDVARDARGAASGSGVARLGGVASLAEQSVRSTIGGRTLDAVGEAERGEVLNAAEAAALLGVREEGSGRQENTGRERSVMFGGRVMVDERGAAIGEQGAVVGGRGAVAGEREVISSRSEMIVSGGEAQARNAEREALASDARIKELVAAENGYARSELEAGANVVGAESKKEVRERLRDDRDDLKMEEGAGWEHDLLTKGQERLTDAAVKQIDTAVNQKAVQPAELERLRFLGMNAILATYGRKFGERN